MDELIAMLEKATEPSQELDGRIYCAINGMTFRSTARDGSIHFEPHGPHKTRTMVTPHPYTSSLDEALTLVPTGFAADVSRYTSGTGDARLWQGDRHVGPYGASTWLGDSRPASPAIALCIAALKARAALTAA